MQVDVQAVSELGAHGFPDLDPRGLFLLGAEVTSVDLDLASDVDKSAQLHFATKCCFENSELVKFPPISRHRKPISPLMGPITWLV